jgi:DNA primase
VIIERWRGTEHFTPLNILANWDITAAESDLEGELLGALKRLNHRALEQETERLYTKSRLSDLTTEERERLKSLLRRTDVPESLESGLEK